VSKKLKILYHHRVAAQDGQSVHIKELTAAFKALGHDLIFVGPSLRPKEFGEESGLLALVRKVLPQFIQELLELAYGYRAYRKLLHAYKTHRPDILYERHNLFLPAGSKLKAKTGIPFLLEVNAPLTEERSKYSGLQLKSFAGNMEAATWRAADMTFPVSNVLAETLRLAGVKDANITVMHNGINVHDYSQIDTKKIRKQYGLGNRIVLGFTGFLREWHRLDHVISMIANFPAETSPHLLVVGEGPAVETCAQLASSLGISERVHFAGFRTRSEIPEHLAAMDIALQPAVTDYASPLKIFEYMQSSLAIIAPDQPNIREILSHRKNALLFDPQDFAAAEDEILQLVGDTALRKRLGSAAKATIKASGYTWFDNAARITAIAEKML
jgi:glycosyltransferase involved in cell wall biosynthesis